MIINAQAVSTFIAENLPSITGSSSLSFPHSFEAINSLLDKYLCKQPPSSAKKMSEHFIKKLKINPSSEWKAEAQKIIHLYLNTVEDIEMNARQSLQLLEDELKTLSLYEIRSKYQKVLQLVLLEKADPLFLNFLKKLYTKESDAAIQQESAGLKKSIVDQFGWVPVYRDEMLRLLVQAKQDHLQERGMAFNCYVVDYRDLPFFLELAAQQAVKQENASFRVLILVRNDVHYTALDCHFTKKYKKAALF
ncbi:Conserved hypothetical protein [Candidatus Protochlamydia naegleriophila]|uniref:Uncharacterized protein n=1 Tax=Candidatus Protochlamydia naegleriophila TaxID=389348 RepID=A0A0U5JC10_9BACT|nr:hypothetical protein [Candidatus Protochlamydia naegleriophila]CUI16226.1 Conserved hypothetical protein [Candidatus Protochlamydia naegleriophila]